MKNQKIMIKEIKSFVASSLLTFFCGFSPVVLSLLFVMPTGNVFAHKHDKMTVPFVLRKFYGCANFCEALIVNQTTGKIHRIVYHKTINAAEGTEIMIVMGKYAYNWNTFTWYRVNHINFLRIVNPRNGNWSWIRSSNRIE